MASDVWFVFGAAFLDPRDLLCGRGLFSEKINSWCNGQRDTLCSEEFPRRGRCNLFAVGDPDVFDLGGVLEEEAVRGGGGVEPVDVAAFVGEDLFEISSGKSFCG